MNKNSLKKDDILIFKNNNTAVYDSSKIYVIEENYDDELNCLVNDNYTIVKVYRPEYRLIFDKENEKNKQKRK